MRTILSMALLIACHFLGGCGSVAATSGFLDRTVVVAGSEYRYQVYVPPGRDISEHLPVVLALHGGGEYGRDGARQTTVGLGPAIRRHPERFPALVVFPQVPADGTPGFQGLGARIALAALERTIDEYAADRSRVYLAGLSMGGNGAWYLAYHQPDRFAAALVACGFVGEFTGRSSGVRYPPIVPGTSDPHGAIAARLAGLPVWIFHGDADPVVSVEESRRMYSALKSAGAEVRYTELAGVGHDAWDPAYERADVIAWLLAHRRGVPVRRRHRPADRGCGISGGRRPRRSARGRVLLADAAQVQLHVGPRQPQGGPMALDCGPPVPRREGIG
jgi:predicted peptidase